MKNIIRDSEEHGLPSSSINPDPASNLSVVLQSLTLDSVDPKLNYEFSQSFDLDNFQLGDKILAYTKPELSQDSVEIEQDHQYLYLVCQGRVRLLGFDAEKQ
ncbi:hypothetical protein, partial [Moorena sp. SIO3I6]|uniref:hypothetical protein n=1 Tax=Moorena sp. SIO3I6 TaxID=2607831 RepID=UPI0013F93383